MLDAILLRDRSKALFALVSLSLLVGLILLGLADQKAQTITAPSSKAAVGYSDLALYHNVITDMRGGAGYYDAAVSEAHKHHYPLRPFVTVRLPTLAWLLTFTGEKVGQFGLMALALITLCAWAKRLTAEHLTKPQYALTIVCLTSGLFPAFVPRLFLFHETWAGVLIALSLAIRRKDAWTASVLVGLAAALTREIAGAYLLAMAVMALRDRNTREAIAWTVAIAILALALILHAMNVHALVTADDLASPGWLDFGGWNFVLQTARWNAFLAPSPDWLLVAIVPLVLFGFTADQIDQRLPLVVGGYITTFLIAGRPDNFYWGLLIAPLWPLGLAGTWSAMTECLRDVRCFIEPHARPQQAGE